VRLGTDRAWRAAVAARLTAGTAAVVDRPEPLAALQRFLAGGRV
jgi:hypothetical protein